MKIDHLKRNLEKRSKTEGLIYELGRPASNEIIIETEQRLAVRFPDKIKLFYSNYNGLKSKRPDLEILPLEKLQKYKKWNIHFSTIAGIHRICFDTSSLNDADEWNIINDKTGFLITLTMASFWSNKIWAWIDNRRNIWQSE